MCVQSLPVLNGRLLFKIMGYFKYLKFFVNDFFCDFYIFDATLPQGPGAQGCTRRKRASSPGGSWHPDTQLHQRAGIGPLEKAGRKAAPIRSCALHQRHAGRASGPGAALRDGGSQDSRVADGAITSVSIGFRGIPLASRCSGVNAPTVALIRSSRSRSIARPSRKMLDRA